MMEARYIKVFFEQAARVAGYPVHQRFMDDLDAGKDVDWQVEPTLYTLVAAFGCQFGMSGGEVVASGLAKLADVNRWPASDQEVPESELGKFMSWLGATCPGMPDCYLGFCWKDGQDGFPA